MLVALFVSVVGKQRELGRAKKKAKREAVVLWPTRWLAGKALVDIGDRQLMRRNLL